MMKYIVLVNGFSNSGKDTFSDFLVKTGNNFVKYAFADELKSYIFVTAWSSTSCLVRWDTQR